MPEQRDGLRRNVELKARDLDPARSRAVCLQIDADDQGELWQRDTYFEVGRGRLKLREQEPGADQLVFYERADDAAERLSAYWLANVGDARALRQLLGAAHGEVAVVEKRRRLFLWDCVRIHLDEVSGLGSFLELEAVARPTSDLTREQALVRSLRARLGITDEQLVPSSYADLVTRR
ncbi:MAG: class IV adenylate cyclase [Gaiellales bacterium]